MILAAKTKRNPYNDRFVDGHPTIMTRPFACVRLRWLIALTLVTIAIAYLGLRGNPPSNAVPEQVVLHGPTMGTTYSIRYRPEAGSPPPKEIQRLIDTELEIVNQQMSTYRGDSEISRFNESRSTEWFPVSMDTAMVVDLAQQIAKTSGGAFDITVGPLVNLWGFGPDGGHQSIPSQSQVDAARAICGYENLSVRLNPPALKKEISELRVDLSAIAKGHGSDRLRKLISSKGILHLFVEIGGEIATQGYRDGDSPWRIGIEAPNVDQRSIQTTIELSGESLATSGDYRNFFERSKVRYSHTIDPKTGRPVTLSIAVKH